jgi:hypothetical protein
MKSSASFFYFDIAAFVFLTLFFVEVRFQTEAASTNQIVGSQRYENVVCRIKVINIATGAMNSTQWMSEEDAKILIKKAKKMNSRVLFFKLICEKGKSAPQIMVMIV